MVLFLEVESQVLWKKTLKEWLVNGGSLSVFNSSGMPCVANILPGLGITAPAKVEETVSIYKTRAFNDETEGLSSGEKPIEVGSDMILGSRWQG